MQPLDNSWKNNFANSQALYSFFQTPNLLASVKGVKSIMRAIDDNLIDDGDILRIINNLVKTINFGNIAHVPSVPVDGTTGNVYPNASVNTPLTAFRICTSVDSTPDKPRVVITAGMHARELAPPLALASFFSAAIVNYVVNNLVNGNVFNGDANGGIIGTGFPLVHGGFQYKTGANHVFDKFDNPILNTIAKTREQNFADSKIEEPINIEEYNFTGIVDLLDNLEIIFFPTCNPAGLDFVLTQTQESLDDAEVRVSWRKNRAAISQDTIPFPVSGIANYRDTNIDSHVDNDYFAIGVDINRNADIAWYYNQYYSADYLETGMHSCSRNPFAFSDYVGRGPNSELETRAILSALMSDYPGMDIFPQNLAPTINPGPLVYVHASSGLPIGLHESNSQSGVVEDMAYNLAGNPQCSYNGYLFYLDIHSHSRYIMVPWSMDTLSTVVTTNASNKQTYLNANYNRRRDGVSKLTLPQRSKMNVAELKSGSHYISSTTLAGRSDTYQEGFPSRLAFDNDDRLRDKHELPVEQVNGFAAKMLEEIRRAVTWGASPTNKPRLSRRSTYTIGQSPLIGYTITGSPTDFAFALNIRDIIEYSTNAPLPTTGGIGGGILNSVRTGPVIALAIEVGHEDDGGFYPLDRYPNPTSGTQSTYPVENSGQQGVYSKVERETFAAIHSFLKQSLAYFRKQ